MFDLCAVKTASIGYNNERGQGALIQMEILGGTPENLKDAVANARRRMDNHEKTIRVFNGGDDETTSSAAASEEHDALVEMEGVVMKPGKGVNCVSVESIFVSLACEGRGGRDSQKIRLFPKKKNNHGDAKNKTYGSLNGSVTGDDRRVLVCKVDRPLVPYCYHVTVLVSSNDIVRAVCSAESCILENVLALKYFIRYVLRLSDERMDKLWRQCNFARVWDHAMKGIAHDNGCVLPILDHYGATEDARTRVDVFVSSVEALVRKASSSSDKPLFARESLRKALVSYVCRIAPLCNSPDTWAKKNIAESARMEMFNAEAKVSDVMGLIPAARLLYAPDACNFVTGPEIDALKLVFPGDDYLLQGLGVFHVLALYRSLFHADGNATGSDATTRRGDDYMSPAYCACIPELASVCPSALSSVLPPAFLSAYTSVYKKLATIGKDSEGSVRGVPTTTVPNNSDCEMDADIYNDDDPDDEDFFVWGESNNTNTSTNGTVCDDDLVAAVDDIEDALMDKELLCALEDVENTRKSTQVDECVTVADDVDWDTFMDIDQEGPQEGQNVSRAPVPIDTCVDALEDAVNSRNSLEERIDSHPTHSASSLVGFSMADVLVSYPECPEKTTPSYNGAPSRNCIQLKIEFVPFVNLALEHTKTCGITLQEIMDIAVMTQIDRYKDVGHTSVPYPVLETRMLQWAECSITSDTAVNNGAVSEDTMEVFGSVHEKYGKNGYEFGTSFRAALTHFDCPNDDVIRITSMVAWAVARLASYGTSVAILNDKPIVFKPSELAVTKIFQDNTTRFFEEVGIAHFYRMTINDNLVESIAMALRSRLAFSTVGSASSYRHEKTIERAIDKIYTRSIRLREEHLARTNTSVDVDGMESPDGLRQSTLGGMAPGIIPDERNLPVSPLGWTPFARYARNRGWDHEQKKQNASRVNAFLEVLLEEEACLEEDAIRRGVIPETKDVHESAAALALPSSQQWIVDEVVSLKGGRRPVAMMEYDPSAEQEFVIRQVENGTPFVNVFGAGGGGKSCAPANVVGSILPSNSILTGFMHTQVDNIGARLASGKYPYPGIVPCTVLHQLVVSHSRTCNGVGRRLRPLKKEADLEGERSIPFFHDADYDVVNKGPCYCPFNGVRLVVIDELFTNPFPLIAAVLDLLASACFKNLMVVMNLGDPFQLPAVDKAGLENSIRMLGETSFYANKRFESKASCTVMNAIRYRNTKRFVYERIVPADIKGPMDDEGDDTPSTDELPIFPVRFVQCQEMDNRSLPTARSLQEQVDAGVDRLAALMEKTKKRKAFEDMFKQKNSKKRPMSHTDAGNAPPVPTKSRRMHEPLTGIGYDVSESVGYDAELAITRPLVVAGGRSTPLRNSVDYTNGELGPLQGIVDTSYSVPQTEDSLLCRIENAKQSAMGVSDDTTHPLLHSEDSQFSWQDTPAKSVVEQDSDGGCNSDIDFDEFFEDRQSPCASKDDALSFMETATVKACQVSKLPAWYHVLLEHASRGIITQEDFLAVFRSNKEVNLARAIIRPFFALGKQELTSGFFRGELCMFKRSFLGMCIQNRLTVRVLSEIFFKYMIIDKPIISIPLTQLMNDMLDDLTRSIARACAPEDEEDEEEFAQYVTVLELTKITHTMEETASGEGAGGIFNALVMAHSAKLFRDITILSDRLGLDTAELVRIYLLIASEGSTVFSCFRKSVYVPESIKGHAAANIAIEEANSECVRMMMENDDEESGEMDQIEVDKNTTLYMSLFKAAVYNINREFARRFDSRQRRASETGDVQKLLSLPIDDPKLQSAYTAHEAALRGGSALVYPINRGVMRHAIKRSRVIHGETGTSLNQYAYIAPFCEQRYLNATKPLPEGGPKDRIAVSKHHVSVVLATVNKRKFSAMYFPTTDAVKTHIASPCFRTVHSAQSHDASNVYEIMPRERDVTHASGYTSMTRTKETLTSVGSIAAYRKRFDYKQDWSIEDSCKQNSTLFQRMHGKTRRAPSAPDLNFSYTTLPRKLRTIAMKHKNAVDLTTETQSNLTHARYVHAKKEAYMKVCREDERAVDALVPRVVGEKRTIALRVQVLSRVLTTSRRVPFMLPSSAPLGDFSTRGDNITNTMVHALASIGRKNDTRPTALKFLPADPTMTPRVSSANALDSSVTQDPFVKCCEATEANWTPSRLFPTKATFEQALRVITHDSYRVFGERYLNGRNT